MSAIAGDLMIKRFYSGIAISIICLALFSLLSKFEDRPALRNLDVAVTVKVQERIDRSAHLRLAYLINNVMEGATFFAAPAFTSIAVVLLTGYAVFDWKKRRFRLKGLMILLGFILILLVELYGKSIVHHPSPPFSMIKHPTSVFPANYVNEQFSYPSGHAARAVFIGLVLYSVFSIHNSVFKSVRKSIWLIIGITAYVLLVGVSRIYLGEHWFSDVLGGWFVGSGMGLLIIIGFLRG